MVDMRRKDRQMDKEFALKVKDKASFAVVSMVDENNEPPGLPLSIVRDGDNLYFHSAKDGRKVRIFDKNPKVSIAFVSYTNIPELYSKEDLDEIARDESKAGLLISSVFTTEFESAIVKGTVVLVEDEEERIKVLDLVCQKYTPSKMDYFNMAIKSGLKRTNVYKIEIEEITSKRKRYDKDGQEMKWGRME